MKNISFVYVSPFFSYCLLKRSASLCLRLRFLQFMLRRLYCRSNSLSGASHSRRTRKTSQKLASSSEICFSLFKHVNSFNHSFMQVTNMLTWLNWIGTLHRKRLNLNLTYPSAFCCCYQRVRLSLWHQVQSAFWKKKQHKLKSLFFQVRQLLNLGNCLTDLTIHQIWRKI